MPSGQRCQPLCRRDGRRSGLSIQAVLPDVHGESEDATNCEEFTAARHHGTGVKTTAIPSFRPALVAVVDIGSPAKGRLGWYASPADQGGQDVEVLTDLLAKALSQGPCALGFEAPMFVPYGRELNRLTSARVGERNRSWSAGAGAGALATALVIVPYVLRRLRDKAPSVRAVLDWRQPPSNAGELLLFEAFVTSRSKGSDHVDDARLAARKFESACPYLDGSNAIAEEDCLGLLGAALLRTGWTTDLTVLESPVLVVMA